MPRPNLGARLAVKEYQSGRKYWVVRTYVNGRKRDLGTGIEVGREKSSGNPETDPEAKLREIVAQQAPRFGRPRRSTEITVDEILTIYATKFIPADPRLKHSRQDLETLRPAGDATGRDLVEAGRRVAFHIDRLAGFWRDDRLVAVRGETCRRYLAARQLDGVISSTVRLELGTLSAAINYCRREGYIHDAPAVWKPPKPRPRDKWLSETDVASLLRAARHVRGARHYLPLFILLSVNTGTRKRATLSLKWKPNESAGHIDLENGLLFRSAVGEIETRKRKPPAPIPRHVVPFLRNARLRTREFVFERNPGMPVDDIRKGFAIAAIDAGFFEEIHDPETGEILVDRGGEPRRRATISPHILRHTCATWLMQRGVPKWDAAGFLGMSLQTLESTYGHHHPEFMRAARDALAPSNRKRT